MIATGRHKIFKLKIGKPTVAEDMAHVARSKSAPCDAASIGVDVNRSRALTDARRGLAALQVAGCELAEPITYREFHLEVPQGPGIGATLDPDRIEAYRCDRTRSVAVTGAWGPVSAPWTDGSPVDDAAALGTSIRPSYSAARAFCRQ